MKSLTTGRPKRWLWRFLDRAIWKHLFHSWALDPLFFLDQFLCLIVEGRHSLGEVGEAGRNALRRNHGDVLEILLVRDLYRLAFRGDQLRCRYLRLGHCIPGCGKCFFGLFDPVCQLGLLGLETSCMVLPQLYTLRQERLPLGVQVSSRLHRLLVRFSGAVHGIDCLVQALLGNLGIRICYDSKVVLDIFWKLHAFVLVFLQFLRQRLQLYRIC